MLKEILIPNCLGIDDTPIWMIYKNFETGEYESVLVAWYNFDRFNEEGFLTLNTFGTQEEAEIYLKDFWDSYWRLSL